MNLLEIIQARRDTRHFTADPVPDEVLQTALLAGHHAPSVGLTDATRFYVIRSPEVKKAVKQLFDAYDAKAADLTDNASQKKQYQALKLEGIEEAPLGLVIAYDRSVLNQFTIGTVGSNEAIKHSAVCAAQNIWLSLTDQGYSMGWVSILNYDHFKKLLNLPDHIEPLGYFCVGKPATHYDHQPMLQQLGWKKKSAAPAVAFIDSLPPSSSIATTRPQTNSAPTTTALLASTLQTTIDQKIKPLGSLGKLESLAHQIGMTLGSPKPTLIHPHLVVFAADHGIADHGVSAYPQEITRLMVEHFLAGDAAINVFAKQNHLNLSIVDAGVNYDFPQHPNLIHAKIAKGTQSFLFGPAMSPLEAESCSIKGTAIATQILSSGCNCLAFGEMGIGNTASAAILMHLLTGIPLTNCVGMGTATNPKHLPHKLEILSTAVANYHGPLTLDAITTHFAGFEILQMAAAMLETAKHPALILIDGFIATVAFLIAYQKNPACLQHAIFCHTSAELGHQALLNHLGVKPLLDLNLRLGEGTGCALALPLLQSALAFLHDMACFNPIAPTHGS